MNKVADPGDHPPEIGPYRILDVLGEGGMSVVYLAEQSEPVKRRVALKILKPGMDSKQIVARFESERQALAVLDHPNIAKIFDGGIAESGRPYFVMEQVKGDQITDYCDDHRLGNKERLKIFIKVCSAVQHSHLKGLIHRDLKPSNILVGIVDGEPQPKVIDFGIAKATTATLTDSTLYTRVGQIIGTPQYMSPEQANITGLDVDTRTDIYSLGVVLYELLVGTVPLDLGAIGDQAMQVALRERDPSKPSTRFTELGDTREEVAKARGTKPDRLHQQLKGDLDWIVMRAIEKDRTRRYETANALAMECRRFLNHEPVLARPPSPGYLLKRFIRRNRIGVAATAVALLAILAGATVSTIAMVRAIESERATRQEANTAQRVTDFLVNLFESSDPFAESGGDITSEEILGRGVERIDRELEQEPILQARLLATMGKVYMQLGLYDDAERLLNQAFVIQQKHLDTGSVQILRTQIDRAWLAGQTEKLETAQQIYVEILPELREGEKYVDVVPATADWALVINDYGTFQWQIGDYESARHTLEQALQMSEEANGPEHREVATTLANLALVEQDSFNLDNALALYERALVIQERNDGPGHPSLVLILGNLASTTRRLGEFEAARSHLERALSIVEDTFEPSHPVKGWLNNGLGIVMFKLGDYDESLKKLESAESIWADAYGMESSAIAANLQHRARVFHAMGNLDEAKSLYERSAHTYEVSLGADHPEIIGVLKELAEVLEKLGEIDGARTYFKRAVNIANEKLSPTNPYLPILSQRYQEFLERNDLMPE